MDGGSWSLWKFSSCGAQRSFGLSVTSTSIIRPLIHAALMFCGDCSTMSVSLWNRPIHM